MGRLLYVLILLFAVSSTIAADDVSDGESSKKILGSSVVTSVSVIMETGNGTKIMDAIGKPVPMPSGPSPVASPINLLNPDRYEFFTFNDNGELVKRLMTLEEIQGIIANGDGEDVNYNVAEYLPEKKVNDIVSNVQNVLKEQMVSHKPNVKPVLDTPDVSNSWSMILPAFFGNTGEEVVPEKTPVVGNSDGDDITMKIKEFEKLTTPLYGTSISSPSMVTFSSSPSSIKPSTSTIKTTIASSSIPISVSASTSTSTTKEPSSTFNLPLTTYEKITTDEFVGSTKSDVSSSSSSTTTTSTTTTSTTTTTTETPLITVAIISDLKYNTTNLDESSDSPTVSIIPVEDVLTDKPTTVKVKLTSPETTPVSITQERLKTSTKRDEMVNVRSTTPMSTEQLTEETTILPKEKAEFSTWSSVKTTASSTTPTSTTQKQREESKKPLISSTTEALKEILKDEVLPSGTTISGLAALKSTTPIWIIIKRKPEVATSEKYYTQIPNSTQKIEEDVPIEEMKNIPLITHSPLSSTKIYEINTKFSGKPTETISESIPTETYSQSTTESIEDTTFTTQPSLIESIHQLFLQTVNRVEDPIVDVNANDKVESALMTMKDKPMQDLQDEAATIGSAIETKYGSNTDNKINVSDVTEIPTTTNNEELNFSAAVSSVLSQIYSLDGTSTLEDFSSTEVISEFSTVPMDETTTTKITEETTLKPMIKINITDVKIPDVKIPDVKIPDVKIPAKSDLSAEIEFVKINENVSSFKTETSSQIPYGEKLTTKAALTSSLTPNNNSWLLVSTIPPPTSIQTSPSTPPTKSPPTTSTTPQPPVKLPSQPFHGFGLEETTSRLDTDVYQFVELCNELSFGFWNAVTNGISSARSVFVSPFAATSLLAMVFLGARGATSGEMNEILKLDDMVTFNPHLIFKNVSETIDSGKGSGVAVSVIARELYSDRSKGKLLNFYKERAKQFYDGFVEEVGFKEIGDVVRRRTNLIVKKNSGGKIQEYLKDSSVTLRPPLAGVSASIFETDCSSASTEGRDGELHFVVLPSIRQRKLVPIPAAVYRSGFLAGYDPQLDATAAAIGGPEGSVSAVFVVPGQQGIAAPGDGLLRLERQLVETAFKKGSWARLLRSLIPRPGLELQIPRFMHKSIINATLALQRMGLKDLFSFDKADLRGLNGQAHELHLSDVLQLNTFATCAEDSVGEDHHVEIYPATSRRPSRRSRKLGFYLPESVFNSQGEEPRDYQRSFDDPLHDPDLLSLPLPLRPRQARLPDAPRLRFDRPFLFFVRHNPTGLVLHMGRFNPRLLP